MVLVLEEVMAAFMRAAPPSRRRTRRLSLSSDQLEWANPRCSQRSERKHGSRRHSLSRRVPLQWRRRLHITSGAASSRSSSQGTLSCSSLSYQAGRGSRRRPTLRRDEGLVVCGRRRSFCLGRSLIRFGMRSHCRKAAEPHAVHVHAKRSLLLPRPPLCLPLVSVLCLTLLRLLIRSAR